MACAHLYDCWLENVCGVEVGQYEKVQAVGDVEGLTQQLFTLPLQVSQCVLKVRTWSGFCQSASHYLIWSGQKLVTLLLNVVNLSSVYIDQHIRDCVTVDTLKYKVYWSCKTLNIEITVNINLSRGFLHHVVHKGCFEERWLCSENRFMTAESFPSNDDVNVCQLTSLKMGAVTCDRNRKRQTWRSSRSPLFSLSSVVSSLSSMASPENLRSEVGLEVPLVVISLPEYQTRL